MRHQVKGRKLGFDSSHRKSVMRSLVTAIISHERIETTEMRAKEMRRFVDRVITYGKRADLNSRRLATAMVHDKEVIKKVFGELAERYKSRSGGYTRIIKLMPRRGDNANIAIIELVKEGGKEKKTRRRRKAKAGHAGAGTEAAVDTALETSVETHEETAAETKAEAHDHKKKAHAKADHKAPKAKSAAKKEPEKKETKKKEPKKKK